MRILRSECVHVSGESWRARSALTGEPRLSESETRYRVISLSERRKNRLRAHFFWRLLTAYPRAVPAGVNAQLRKKAHKLIEEKGPIQPERLQSFDCIFSILLFPLSPSLLSAECQREGRENRGDGP